MARHGPAGPGDPRADGVGARPGRPPRRASATARAASRTSARSWAWRATTSSSRTCTSSTTGWASTRTAASSASLKSTGIRPGVRRAARRPRRVAGPALFVVERFNAACRPAATMIGRSMHMVLAIAFIRATREPHGDRGARGRVRARSFVVAITVLLVSSQAHGSSSGWRATSVDDGEARIRSSRSRG